MIDLLEYLQAKIQEAPAGSYERGDLQRDMFKAMIATYPKGHSFVENEIRVLDFKNMQQFRSFAGRSITMGHFQRGHNRNEYKVVIPGRTYEKKRAAAPDKVSEGLAKVREVEVQTQPSSEAPQQQKPIDVGGIEREYQRECAWCGREFATDIEDREFCNTNHAILGTIKDEAREYYWKTSDDSLRKFIDHLEKG